MRKKLLITVLSIVLLGANTLNVSAEEKANSSINFENNELNNNNEINFEIDNQPVLNILSSGTNCQVDKNGIVTYMSAFSSIPATDDGKLYLYGLAPYEYNIGADSELILAEDWNNCGLFPNLQFSVNYRQQNTRLYSKFAICIKQGGRLILISQPTYITNPEALAWNTLMRYPRTKKSTQGEDFNNLYLNGSHGPELGWIYKTIQVLNTGENATLTNPMSRATARRCDSHKLPANFYMFNASEKAGIRLLSEQLEYYVINSKGGENWIIGNEVNTRLWNYMAWTDWDTYVREYAQAFRVAYNTIKSINANARVFVSLDQYWDMNMSPASKEYYEIMDGKDFLLKFDYYIKQNGNIDWSLSQHPYPAPLTNSKFWDMSGVKNGAMYAQQVRNGQLVTFQNLSVLTDFMQTSQMRNPEGKVRHIILSELGLTNAQGIEVQAAALCASYAAIEQNPYIDEAIYLLNYSEPRIDTRLTGFSREVYDNMDGANADSYFEWAKAYIGINDWSEIFY